MIQRRISSAIGRDACLRPANGFMADFLVYTIERGYIDVRVRELSMTDGVRLTQPTLKVLKLLLEKPNYGRSGAEISRITKVGSGTLYPMLARLELAGWLESEWEVIDPREAGRPRRRFYKLTAIGQTCSLEALSDLQVVVGELAWNW